MANEKLLVLNPGGTTTKLAYFEGERECHLETIEHDPADLSMFGHSVDQLKYRLYAVGEVLHRWNVDIHELDAAVGRGGPLGPMPAGTYAVDGAMTADVRAGRVLTDHPSLLGCLLARKLTAALDKPAFIVDPVSVDELADVARLSGLKDLPRHSLWHALNSRYAAREACVSAGIDYANARLVVGHLGSGISISAQVGGRCIDVNNANDMGPFAPTRAGGVPATGLVKLCFAEGESEAALKRRLTKEGGLLDYLGTADLREVERRMDGGDADADRVWRAMAYQVAKEIGAMAVVCGGPERIVLTGGLARSARFVAAITAYTDFIAPTEVLPGEMEMEALAVGALRVLRGEEEALSYDSIRKSWLKGGSE